ncbi:class I SAM-dependent methyltransferase [Geodermatophilus sp. YIM 151500]|uniref:class I SAM-dependent methyltransferase n=1 Tax=Geodermatophilus sp. YIM 151500 TaxID=2984531 RepID=UPI0021E3976A|nr:class I SAM-dependent methyltransferase [Geodermatophilus sp. YIM 151500]MCV2487782.1 class I SAM-dependent methyltransferase [Geodermatophilus sp. YIM 151500]
MAGTRRSTPPPTFLDANRLWVDSRLRYEFGLRIEGSRLARLGALGGSCVEIGTGRRGLGARVAVTRFGATDVRAFDVHAASVERARRRCADLGDRVRFEVGDATALPVDDGSVDLVVSFHALHHVDDWRAAVREAGRVLRPGGLFALTEMTSRVVDAPWLRAVSRHPADRFDVRQLVTALRDAGLQVDPSRLRTGAGDRWVQIVAPRSR